MCIGFKTIVICRDIWDEICKFQWCGKRGYVHICDILSMGYIGNAVEIDKRGLIRKHRTRPVIVVIELTRHGVKAKAQSSDGFKQFRTGEILLNELTKVHE